ncbi:hypothetical protein Ais01nite_61730 [Asanoa ishikariensis]|uniref:Uncharacterized conserved protein, Ntn-hydrolase superfamily n=1 Tax=Asanoa ishikariensis TaxID=137265 RepID=A0A1H3P5R0_9ACTN|nr:DUF1028 domain-containing protein [Asanoa ishikariensis]GIF68138.1 hypothetical protein Ais01nite_61730 [Asanoa ishikariensis]SDY95719.1 Uncharacterized conserved protein, Ntn-hydrolase superfamily [Asanoa ishikariensis]
MTFSIVARSADGHSHGIAVASKFLAVGSAVPAAEAQTGAVATQSYANLAYRPQGLALLRTGVDAAGVVAGLTAADEGRAQRQVGVVGPTGDGATYTGADCHDWAGGVAGDGFAIQGNILVGPEVVERMRDAWLASDPAAPLARRLLAALRAGDEAGGDKRGRQSAALLVVARGQGYGGTSDVVADLRVDDHTEPVPELIRLLDMHELLFGKPDPATLLALDGALAAEVRGRLVAAGHEGASLDDALASWAGVENLEERIVPGKIDPLVLAHLRGA